ncbi:LLM class flavin-dependent oxidoreductase [Nocardia sp. NPDC057227]|uniref:LLM class flavin-dependent oxidoreductase n=1 Tax=Nocardia sp. NPDC057227 TaxID=3346056 RepID=UPI0036456834
MSTASVPEIGVFLPTSTPDPERPIIGDVVAAARTAERLGLDSVWATDQLVASAPILDGAVVLAAAAAVTERVRLGWGVLILALRPAPWVAKQVATLQHVSGNRLVLGVGTGNTAHGDGSWRAAGVPVGERAARTDAALELLPDLIAGKPVGAYGAPIALAPVAPMPPLVVAGEVRAARRRAVRFGAEWLSLRPEVGALEQGIAELRALAAELGRPVPAVSLVAPLSPDGPDATTEQAAAFAAAGVRRLILSPTGPDTEHDYAHAAEVRTRLRAH